MAGCWKYSEKCSVGTLLVKSQHGCGGVTLKGFILVLFLGIALWKEQSGCKASLMALAASVGRGALRHDHASGRKEMVFLIYKVLLVMVGG